MMKIFVALSLALALTTTISVNADAGHGGEEGHSHGHDDSHGHKCACDAIIYDFTIDCGNAEAMTDALARLQVGQCASNCDTEACEKDWLLVQTHHDHCPEDGIPTAVENGFHDYDRVCKSCDILREEIPNASQCPSVNCEDGSGNAAYQRLLTKNCNLQFQCTENNCKDDWLTLRVVHDTCDHGALSESAEQGLHALEEPCATFQCNLPLDQIASALECTSADLAAAKADHEHDHDDHDVSGGDENPSSPTNAPGGSGSGTGNFDMGSGVSKLALGSVVLMNVVFAALL